MRRIAVLCAVVLTLLATPLAAAGQGPTGQGQPAVANAYDTVASCLRERGHLLVLALIDESGSLRSSDPDGRRVDAMKAAFRSFAQFGRGPDASDAPKIELLLAAFATQYTEPGPWQPLNSESRPELERRADEFAQRNQGGDTDFATALDGAKAAFAKKEDEVTQGGGTVPCRLLLVFTDGQYDIDSRAGPPKYYAPNIPLREDRRVEEAGRRYLCDPGGVADHLRATDTVVVAIALRPDTPGPPPDQSFLRGLAEAQSAGGHGCGERTSPPGVLVEAQGLGRLLEAFDSAVVQALGGTSVPGAPDLPVCPLDDASVRCVRSFELDTSLSEFHILVDLFRPGIAVDITPPEGAPARMVAGADRQLQLAGAALDVASVAPLALVIDGRLPPGDPRWVGTWTVRFVDETGGPHRDAAARAQITVFGGLTAVADPGPVFRAGEQTEFTVRVIDAAGSPRTPAEFVRSATVTAAVVTPAGERQDIPLTGPRADGSYQASHTVTADSTDPSVELVLTLDVTTRAGLRLRPRVQSYQVQVQPPAGFPLVGPAQLVLTRIEERGEARGTLTVTGTPGSTGCAWVDGFAVTAAPNGAGAVTLHSEPDASSRDSCIRVEPGQSATITVSAVPDRVRNGVVHATLRVRSTGADPASRTTLHEVRFEMQRHAPPTRWWLLGALLVAGTALPLALLWLLNWSTARFAAPGVLRRAVRRVRVTGDDVQPVDGGWSSPLARDFSEMPDGTPVAPCRSFTDHELQFHTHVPALPLRLPYGSVRVAGHDVLSSGGPAGGGERYRGRVPLDLNAGWVFAVDQVETSAGAAGTATVFGRLFLYINEGENERKANEMLARVRRALPGRVAEAVANLAPPDASTPPEPVPGTVPGEPVFLPPGPPIRRT